LKSKPHSGEGFVAHGFSRGNKREIGIQSRSAVTGKIVGVGSTINHEATTVASHSSGVGFSWQQWKGKQQRRKGKRDIYFLLTISKACPILAGERNKS
jgi:hypothetical protein